MFSSVNRAAAALAVALAAAASAAAGPADDYLKGRQAFHRDDLMGAMKWLRSAAAQGHTDAQALLAYILDRAEEDQEAFRLYSEAASKGNPEAMYGLGTMYGSGEGIPRDEAQAVAWFQRAMDSGHDHSAVVLAEAYLAGSHGLAKDPDKARELLKIAAARGYEPARQRLDRLAGAVTR